MALELTQKEADRLGSVLTLNEKYSTVSGRRVWTEERELEIVELIQSGASICSIIRNQKVSGRKITQIRRKYKLWGA